MSSILAIVSAQAFAALPGDKSVGACLTLERYNSSHRALTALSEGDSLYLVTVVEGAPLLVAVLRHPRFDSGAWHAEPNRTVITNISSVIYDLEFSSGKGVSKEPGKLAMSLQTPRALQPSDVARLESVVSGSPRAAYQAAVASARIEPVRPATPKRKSKTAVTEEAPAPVVGDPLQALCDVRAWRQVPLAGKASVAHALIDQLRSRRVMTLAGVYGRDGLIVLNDAMSGAQFVVIPGGPMEMGYSVDDLTAVFFAMDKSDLDPSAFLDDVAYARPTRLQAIAPFLVSRAPISSDDFLGPDRGTDVDNDVFAVDAALKQVGARLMREDEWEWCAREGGLVRFVGLPPSAHPLRPDQEPDYAEETGWLLADMLESPTVFPEQYAAPDAGHVQRYAHTSWQSRSELVAWHAASRRHQGIDPNDDYRIVLDLASLGSECEPPAAYGIEETLRALSGKGWTRDAALLSLEHLIQATPTAPPEAASLIGPLLSLKALEPKLLLRVFRVVANLSKLDSAAAQALNGHRSLIDDLCGSSDAKSRAHGWLLRAYLPPTVDEGSDWLCAVRGEKDGNVVAMGLYAVTVWAKRDPQFRAVAHAQYEALFGSKDRKLSSLAAMSWAELDGTEALTAKAQDLFAQAVTLTDESVDKLPLYDGALSLRVIELFERAPAEVRDKAVDGLAGSLSRARKQNPKEILGALRLAFPESKRTFSPEALTLAQRALLVALSERDCNVDLEPYGVPNDLGIRRALLGLDAPYMTDKLVTLSLDGETRTLPLFRAAEHLQWTRFEKDPAYKALKRSMADFTPLELAACAFDPRSVEQRTDDSRSKRTRFATFATKLTDEQLFERAYASDPQGFLHLVNAELARSLKLRELGARISLGTLFTARAIAREPGTWLSADILALAAKEVLLKDKFSKDVVLAIDPAERNAWVRARALELIDDELKDWHAVEGLTRGESVVDMGLALEDPSIVYLGLLLQAPFGGLLAVEKLDNEGAWLTETRQSYRASIEKLKAKGGGYVGFVAEERAKLR